MSLDHEAIVAVCAAIEIGNQCIRNFFTAHVFSPPPRPALPALPPAAPIVPARFRRRGRAATSARSPSSPEFSQSPRSPYRDTCAAPRRLFAFPATSKWLRESFDFSRVRSAYRRRVLLARATETPARLRRREH